MNWYLAKIVFQIICGEGNHRAQFDEQLRLIAADNPQQAFEKAKSLGEHEEDAFYNKEKKLVQWKFIDVPELFPLNEMIEGAEMYSRIQEPENANHYIFTIRKKAAQFQSQQAPEIFQLLRDAVLLF